MTSRVATWILRYGPAELAGITLAFSASFVVRQLTHSTVATAYAAAWGEGIGYAGVIMGREYFTEAREVRAARRKVGFRDIVRMAWRLIVEFGPAGIMDTLVTRPLAMGLGIRFLGPVLGLVVGKLSADVIFYAPVIYTYERQRRR